MDIFGLLLSAFEKNSGFFIFLFAVLVIFKFFRTPFFKGIYGEFLVNSTLNKKLINNDYLLLKNVTLKLKEGSTQIDHIIVSRFGIFVLETKNMKGWIYGTTSQKQWTQQIFKKKIKFQNPLHQNYKHTQSIIEKFKLNPECVNSIVVFVGSSTLKNKKPKNVFESVTDVISYVRSFKRKVYTTAEIREIYSAIKNGRMPNNIKTHVNHVNYLKKRNR